MKKKNNTKCFKSQNFSTSLYTYHFLSQSTFSLFWTWDAHHWLIYVWRFFNQPSIRWTSPSAPVSSSQIPSSQEREFPTKHKWDIHGQSSGLSHQLLWDLREVVSICGLSIFKCLCSHAKAHMQETAALRLAGSHNQVNVLKRTWHRNY